MIICPIKALAPTLPPPYASKRMQMLANASERQQMPANESKQKQLSKQKEEGKKNKKKNMQASQQGRCQIWNTLDTLRPNMYPLQSYAEATVWICCA